MPTLAEHVAKQGPLSVRDAVGWVLRTAKTVCALHADGRVHGALSAEAIVISDASCEAEGSLLAREELEASAPYASLDREESQIPSEADDVWALGITLFYALTGTLPYPDGVSAFLSSAARELPTMAPYRNELNVMQPFVDTLIDPLDHPATAERFLNQLRAFSPALAHLEGLPVSTRSGRMLFPAPVEGPLEKAAPGSPPPAPSGTWLSQRTLLAIAALGLGGLAAAALVSVTTDSTPVAEADPPAVPSAPRAAPSADPRPAPAAGSAPLASASPVASAPAAGGDVLVCMSALFPPKAFLPSAGLDALCAEAEPHAWLELTRREIIRASDGRATAASIEWTNLGWYQLAVLALARGRCCAAPATPELPALLSPCKLDAALAELGRAGGSAQDRALVGAMESYRVAAACIATAGGGDTYGYATAPGSQQAALFLRTLQRVAASR